MFSPIVGGKIGGKIAPSSIQLPSVQFCTQLIKYLVAQFCATKKLRRQDFFIESSYRIERKIPLFRISLLKIELSESNFGF